MGSKSSMLIISPLASCSTADPSPAIRHQQKFLHPEYRPGTIEQAGSLEVSYAPRSTHRIVHHDTSIRRRYPRVHHPRAGGLRESIGLSVRRSNPRHSRAPQVPRLPSHPSAYPQRNHPPPRPSPNETSPTRHPCWESFSSMAPVTFSITPPRGSLESTSPRNPSTTRRSACTLSRPRLIR